MKALIILLGFVSLIPFGFADTPTLESQIELEYLRDSIWKIHYPDTTFSYVCLGNLESCFKPKIITYHIESVPNISDPEIVKNGIMNGFERWTKYNPTLRLIPVESNADIMIKSTKIIDGEHHGFARYAQAYKGDIQLEVGGFDCHGNYIQYDEKYISNIMAHEFGHLLGLGHHSNPNHLMYSDEFVQDDYETLGYSIPEIVPEYFVGQEQLVNQKDLLYEQYENILSEYGLSHNDLESGKISVFSTSLATKTNPVINEYNEIVDQLSCYPNFSKGL